MLPYRLTVDFQLILVFKNINYAYEVKICPFMILKESGSQIKSLNTFLQKTFFIVNWKETTAQVMNIVTSTFSLGRSSILDDVGKIANAYITADDYYKLYINGVFVTQGPAPGYPYAYNYNTIDVSRYLIEGENIVAVHTLYQGLINRVWVSGDNRHGLLLDIVIDGNIVLSSDESFLTAIHSAYTPIGIIGYDTQFAEEYDSSAETVGFQYSDYDDSRWNYASLKQNTDYTLVPQPTSMLDFESIKPNLVVRKEGRIFIDFGSNYVGYLKMKARGRRGDKIIILCGQELNEDGTVRYEMRCNCVYKETWLLSGNDDILDQYDYKSFRYVELIIPDGSDVYDISLIARHYPFNLCVSRRFVENNDILKVWNLCVHSINYGVQEVFKTVW